MFFKTYAALALATGFAAAKPIAPRTPQNNAFGGVGRNGQGFSFIDGFNNFNNQQQVIQIQEQNLQIVDNGFQQQIVQQVNEVLIVNNQQNGFNNQLNNLFRKANFRNNFQQQSTVMLVVQEIQVAVDNGIGGQIQSSLFAQSAVVANRGLAATQTVMIFQQETLIAQNILGGVGGFQNFQNNILGQGRKDDVNIPTQTANVQLFGSKPTWSSVAEDPAATQGGVWQAELEDAQKAENNEGDNEVNNQAAEQEKKALDEAAAQEGENAEEENQEGEEENVEEENQEGEEAAQEGEEAAQEGEENQEGEEAAQEGEEEAQQAEKL